MPTLADIRAVAKRAWEIVRQSGPRRLARKVGAELFYRRLVVYEAQLEAPRPAVRSELPLRFEVLQPDGAHAYLDCVPGLDAEQFHRRLRAGDRCYAARVRDEIVAVRWAAFRDVQVTRQGLMLSVGEGGAYLYGAHTTPSWRRRGVGAALTAHLLDHLEAEGHRRALSGWIPENRDGRSLNPSRGRRLALVAVVRLGPWGRELRPRPAEARGRFYRSAEPLRGGAGTS